MSGRPRILVIEDDDAFRDLEMRYLERRGYDMIGAPDGETGLVTFARERPDAVLCDLRLPGMDGLEVLAAITRDAPETPVIVVSGAGALDDAVQALKLGAWDYVTKPMDSMTLLKRAVQTVLERAELLRQNRAYRERLEALNRELERALKQLRADAEAGRALQRKLLPQEGRRFGDWTLSRRLWPSTYLSGDFVDYFRIDERHVGLYIADVAGHGAASAFLTVMLKTLVGQYHDALTREGDDTLLSPHRTLARLDRDLRQLDLNSHVAAIYGVLDLDARELALSGAGHFPYPFVRDAAGWHSEPCPGRPLALFDDAAYRSRIVALPPGTAVLFTSDGVLDMVDGDALDAKVDLVGAAFAAVGPDLDALAARFGLNDARALPDDAALLLLSEGGR